MASFKTWLTAGPVDVVAQSHRAAAIAQAQRIPDDGGHAQFIVVSDEGIAAASPKDQRLYIAWREDGHLRVFGYELSCLPEDNRE